MTALVEAQVESSARELVTAAIASLSRGDFAEFAGALNAGVEVHIKGNSVYSGRILGVDSTCATLLRYSTEGVMPAPVLRLAGQLALVIGQENMVAVEVKGLPSYAVMALVVKGKIATLSFYFDTQFYNAAGAELACPA